MSKLQRINDADLHQPLDPYSLIEANVLNAELVYSELWAGLVSLYSKLTNYIHFRG